MLNWVYIAGRGHSGSTVLDAMLGNAPAIESVGELVSGMGRYDEKCSCGETFRECEYWSRVRSRFEELSGASWDDAVAASKGQAHLTKFPKTLIATMRKRWVRTLVDYTRHIGEAVAGAEHEVVVDSSKEITRALFLLRFVPGTKVIHLLRHPSSILESDYYRLKGGTGFKFLRKHFAPKRWFGPFLFMSVVSWILGNLLSDLVRLFGKERFLRVKYERLVEAPLEEFDRMELFLGVSLDEVKTRVREGKPLTIGHNIGGNHMRFSGEFVFDPKKSRRKGLPKLYYALVGLMCWPQLLAYGYFFRKRR
ncbi:MAG: sulfotransferase [Alkalispirochaetaceae bacterium]